MNPEAQRREHLARLASQYPEAFAMAAASNSRFRLAAQRLRLPARATQLPNAEPRRDRNGLQFAIKEHAGPHRLEA